MTDFAIYIDESFSKGEQAFALAGYIAPVALWENDFTPKWRTALGSAARPISEFHNVDCRHRQNDFKGWTKEEADALTKSVVGVIADQLPKTDIGGIGVAVVLPGNPMPSHARAWQEAAFTASFQWSMVLFMDIALQAMRQGDKVQIVLDDKPSFHRLMQSNWAIIWRDIAADAEGKTVVPPTFERSHETLPLQAADLLAYETAHEAMQRVPEARRPVSKALRRLVEGKQHQANCIWYPDLQERVAIRRRGGQCPTGGTLLFKSEFPWRAPDQWPFIPAEARAADA